MALRVRARVERLRRTRASGPSVTQIQKPHDARRIERCEIGALVKPIDDMGSLEDFDQASRDGCLVAGVHCAVQDRPCGGAPIRRDVMIESPSDQGAEASECLPTSWVGAASFEDPIDSLVDLHHIHRLEGGQGGWLSPAPQPDERQRSSASERTSSMSPPLRSQSSGATDWPSSSKFSFGNVSHRQTETGWRPSRRPRKT